MPNDFEIENGILKKYHGTESDAVIPDGVTEIGRRAFSENESLISVTIPDSVTVIDDYAFYKCKNLASVIIPESVTKIGYYAFYWCNPTSVTIPSRLLLPPVLNYDKMNPINRYLQVKYDRRFIHLRRLSFGL